MPSVRSLISLFVNEDKAVLALETEGGPLELTMSPATAAEIAHIIADGLRGQGEPQAGRNAGRMLYPGQLSPLRIETIPAALGLEAKFVIEAQSAGGTTLTYRLPRESVERWIAGAQDQLQRRRRPSRH